MNGSALTSPKAIGNNATNEPKVAKSILYNVETTGGNEYIHANEYIPSVKPKKANDDQLSKTSRQRNIEKSFLDESKVNKNVARDLMNAKPIFSVQDISGGQAHLSPTAPKS